MILGVLKETLSHEKRVALFPGVVKRLLDLGLEIRVEASAGEAAGYPDAAFEETGAAAGCSRADVLAAAQIIIAVRDPLVGDGEPAAQLQSGQTLIGLLDPLMHPDLVRRNANAGVSTFALELLPRITRAQPMDVLSSMATISGYKAALIAADTLKKMYPMMITAAGTVTPAKVLVLGAGVAGLQAIATSRRLGAVVVAYDIRPAVKEEVESLGARFLELDLETEGAEGEGGYARAMGDDFSRRQQLLLTEEVAASDVVITTALVPGKRAPILLREEAIRGMSPGSVVVDLAAENGGNCEPTRPGQTMDVGGVSLLGPVNLPSMVAFHASQMYARNMAAFLRLLIQDGELKLDLDDEIVRDTLVTHQGEVVNARVKELLPE